MIRFGTFGHTYLDLGGPSMPAASSGDAVTFNIRSLADASRFGHLASGDCLYVLIEGEILKITTGGSGVLTWSGLRGQCGTAAVAHPDGVGVRETVPGQAFDTFIQDPSTAAGDLIYKAAMAAPAAPSLSTGASGGTIAAGAYGVKLTKVDAHGNETLASAAASITTTGATSTITIASPALDGIATGWNCYFTQPGGSTYTKQNSVPFVLGTPYTLATPPTSGGAAPPSTSTAASAITALPVGTANQVLAVDATTGLPAWKTIAPSTTVQANSGGTALSGAVQITGTGPVTVSQSGQIISITSSAALNPMTTQDDLILGGSAGAETRLAAGTNGQVLTIVSGHVAWATPSPSTTIQATGGAPLSGAVQIVGAGSVTTAQSGQVVTVTGVGFANPMTTAGDVIIGGSAGAATRLAKGADNQVLTIDPATHLPVWSATGTTTTLQAESGGTPIAGAVQLHGSGPITISESGQVVTIASSAMTNPMTTAGDLILGGTSGAAGRLAKGADSQILTVDPTTHLPVWAAAPISGFGNPMTTAGDVIVGDTGGTAIRLAKGTDNQVLTIDPTSHLPLWRDSVAGFTNPMTLGGDLIYNPVVTDAALTNVGSAASSTFTTYVSSRAFDGDDTTNHYWTGFTQPWISVDLGSPKAIGSVRIHAVDNTVTIYNIQGSSDNSTWVNVVTGHTMSSSLDETYSFAAVATYRYWRFIGTTYGSGGGLLTFALYQQGSASRLPIGATGAVLTVSGGLPVWAAPTSGFTNPMTTAGDLILGGTAGAAGRLAKGADSTVLTMDPTTHLPVWAAPTGGSGTTVQGGASTKVQLDWTYSGADINGAAISSQTWTDIATAQNFTVDDPASVIEFNVIAGMLIGSTSQNIMGAIMVDSTRYIISGSVTPSGSYGNVFGGNATFALSANTLSAGTHTLKAQIWTGGAETLYLRPSTGPEFLRLQVLERKTTMNTSAAPVSGARLHQAAGQSIASGAWTAMTFDTVEFDTDSLKGTGSAPYGSLTVTKAGKYLIGAQSGFNVSTSQGVRVLVNGAIQVEDYSGAVSFRMPHAETMLNLQVGDIITATTFQNSGSSQPCYIAEAPAALYATSLGGIVSGTAQSKPQLEYALASDISALAIPLTTATWADVTTNQSFTVDDANSVVEIEVNASALVQSGTANGGTITTRLLIDGTVAKSLGGVYVFQNAPLNANPFSGAGTVRLSGLAAGTHTVKVQVSSNVTSGSPLFYCRASTNAGWEFLQIGVIERKLVPASPSYANVDKPQLDYTEATNLLSGTAATVNGWTSFGPSKNFTVDDPNSSIDVTAILALLFQGTGASVDGVGAVLIDGTTRYVFGTNISSSAGLFSYVRGGGINIGSLPAGTHTVQAQYYIDGAATLYLRAASNPNTEMLRLQVIERKVVNTGAGGTLDQAKVVADGTQTIATATRSPVQFKTLVDDTNTLWASGAPTKLTIKTPGRYMLYASVVSATAFTGAQQISFRKNGVATEYGFKATGSTAMDVIDSVTFLDLVATDYVEVYYFQSGGVTMTVDASSQFLLQRIDGYAINPATTLNDMVRATTGGVPERVASTGVQGSVWSTDATGKPGWNGMLTASAKLAADVTLVSANTFYDGPSILLIAGTWLITVVMQFSSSTTDAFTAKLWDGTTVAASGESVNPFAGYPCQVSLAAVVTLGSTTTYKVSGTSTGAGDLMKAAANHNGAGNNATQINAVKIG